MEEPEEEQGGGGTGGIDQDVSYPALAGGNEGLVEFVGDGVEDRDRESQGGGAPGEGRVRFVTSAAPGFVKGAKEKQGEDGVFGDVSGLAHHMDDRVQVVLGDVRHKPADDGADDAGRTMARRSVARRGKDEGHPEKNRQPVFKKGANH